MNNRILSRRGSTLVELIVAMALVSIVSIMIVSFSAMAHSFSGDEQGKHQFIDDGATVRRGITDYLLTCDEIGNIVKVSNSELECGTNKATWNNVTQYFKICGERKVLKGVYSLTFEKATDNPKLLKCTVTGATEKGQTYSQTFVFALRCATFQ